MENYTIPFGLDASSTLKGFSDIEAAAAKAGAEVKAGVNEMNKSFVTASEGGDRLSKTLQDNAANIKNLKETAKAMGKEIADALSGKTSSNDLEAKVKKFRDLLQSISNKNAKIGFSVDEAGFQKFEQMLSKVGGDLNQFVAVIDYAKGELAKLDPNTKEFTALSEQIAIAEGFLEGLGATVTDLNDKSGTLKKELSDIKEEITRMALAGEGGTETFSKLIDRAAELQDKISGVSERVRQLASDTLYLDAGVEAVQGLVAAFTIAQSAAALFGSENEDLQKAILKVQAAMALLQGVQAAANLLNKNSALSIVFLNALLRQQAVATGEATVATNAFTAAILANPVAAFVAAIVLVTAALAAYIYTANKAKEASDEVIGNAGLMQTLLDQGVKGNERRVEREIALSNLRGKAQSDATKITVAGLKYELKIREQYANDFYEASKRLDRVQAQGNLSNKEYLEESKEIGQSSYENDKKIADLKQQIEVGNINLQTQSNKELAELAKKRLEEQRKAAAEAKRINDQILRFTREYEAAQVAAMKDGLAKQIAEIKVNAKAQKDSLNAEVILSKESAELRGKAIIEINKATASAIQKAELEDQKKRTTLILQANAEIASLQKDSRDKEIQISSSNYLLKKSEIEEQYKDEEQTRIKLLAALKANYFRALEKITIDYNLKELDLDEEAEVLGIELMSKYATKSVKVEELKQIEILKVRLKYAKDRETALVDDGTKESKNAILRAKKVVKDLENALDVALEDQSTKGFDWFDAFGLGDLSDKDKAKITQGLNQSAQALGQITDFMVEQYQRQIDKKQEVIDQYDKEIDDLEARLDKEYELREKGFANNAGLLEQELATKKAARDEEIRQQEEIQKKQQALQKAQLIADTAVQASNLITAITSIFKSFATIPFGIGIPLAIATSALMTGAFVVGKVKAFQAVSDGNKFGEGGEIDAPSHAQGGKKYYSQDGNGIELEGGEYVINRKTTQKFKPFIEALNRGTAASLHEQYLQDVLGQMGITFIHKEPAEGLDQVKQRDEAESLYIISHDGLTPQMAGDLNYIRKKMQDGVERWEDAHSYYEKSHGVVTKYPKKVIS